jgi:hypothetical protein
VFQDLIQGFSFFFSAFNEQRPRNTRHHNPTSGLQLQQAALISRLGRLSDIGVTRKKKSHKEQTSATTRVCYWRQGPHQESESAARNTRKLQDQRGLR